jgi:hypothetical protein
LKPLVTVWMLLWGGVYVGKREECKKVFQGVCDKGWILDIFKAHLGQDDLFFFVFFPVT